MIISVAGLIGSGKDTIADYLCRFYGFKRVSFAEPLKDAISSIFGWDREMLTGSSKHSREWREQIDPWWSARLNIPHLTPRWVLQQWGTDVCRQGFHDDIWIAAIENKLRHIKDNVVISDSRFKNEILAIKNLNGTTIRVVRGPNPIWYDAAIEYNLTKSSDSKLILDRYNVHASEYSSVGLEYDYIIENNDSIDVLHSKIDSIINL